MEAEAVINIFDSIWFHLAILDKHPKTSIPPSSHREIQHNPPSNKKVSSQMSFHTRSKSHELPSLTVEDSSPLKPHLQTILSDREMSKPPPLKIHVSHIERRKKRLSKSLSELEFEEVKGFLDLGFVFSEEDKDSNLVEIIPGLHKLGKKSDSHDQEIEVVEESFGMRARDRPYLSEAWELFEYREKENKTLMEIKEWRIPAVANEMDIKDSLRSWAHTVASAVI